MIRLFNRFYGLVAVAACTILYSAWFLTSRNLGDIVPLASGQFRTAASFDQRLVVFGDSWSDNETEEEQGRVWTDWLCGMVSFSLSLCLDGLDWTGLAGHCPVRLVVSGMNASATDTCFLGCVLVLVSPGESCSNGEVDTQGQGGLGGG
jgi:hypothetical protein